MAEENDLRSSLELDISQFRLALRQSLTHVQNFSKSFKDAFKADPSKATKGVDNLGKSLRDASNESKKLKVGLIDLERIVGGILLSQAFYGAKSAIENATGALFTFINEIERSQIALEYFLATPEQATAFLRDLQGFAAETSFNTTQAVAASRKLLAAQFDPNDVRGVLEILNDASAASGGTADQLDRIILAITQIRTNGKIAGQELRQLGEAGIPVYKILQEELGLTGEQVLNVGDLQIDGETGVNAVLRGLEKRYKGAADRLADTIPGLLQTIQDDTLILGNTLFQGPYKALEDFLTVWRDTFSEARDLLFEGGLGRVLEELIPPELHTQLRLIAGSLKSLGNSFKELFVASLPITQLVIGGLITGLSTILPIIAAVVRYFTMMTTAALEAVPGLKFLVAALVTVGIAKVAASAVLFFWRVLRLAVIAKLAGDLVLYFAKAVRLLTLVILRNPIVAGFIALTVAVLHFTGSLKQAVNWVNALLKRLANLAGFDLDAQLQDTFSLSDAITNYQPKFEGVGTSAEEGFGDAVDAAKKADKEFKKFAASFDELYQIPDKSDSDAGGKGGLGDGGLPVPDIPDLDIPPLTIPEIKLPKLKIPDIEAPDIIIGKANYKIEKPPPLDPYDFLPPPNFALAWGLEWESVQAAIRERVLAGWKNWGVDVGTVLTGVERTFGGFSFGALGALGGVLKGLEGLTQGLEGLNKGAEGSLQGLGGTLSGAFSVGTVGALGILAAFSKDVAKQLKQLKTDTETNSAPIGEAIQTAFEVAVTAALGSLGYLGVEGAKKLKELKAQSDPESKGIGEGIKTGIQVGTVAALGAVGVLGTGALGALTTLGTALKPTATAIGGTIKGGFDLGVSGAKTGLSTLATLTSSGLEKVKNTVSPLSTSIGSYFGTAWDNAKTKTTAGWGVVAAGVSGGALAVGTLLSTFTANSGLKFGTFKDSIANTFKGLPDTIANNIKSIPDKIAAVFGKIKIPTFSEIGGAIKTTFKNIVVPGYATGGIIQREHLAMVGEGGKKEAVIPLENSSAMAPFADAVAARLANSNPPPGTPQGSGGMTNLNIGTYIGDDRSLRELKAKLDELENERRGLR